VTPEKVRFDYVFNDTAGPLQFTVRTDPSASFDPALVGLREVETTPLRMLSDNVLIVLEPPPKETKSGIAIVHNRPAGAREHRTARVLAVGPGHYSGCKSCGGERTHLIPTELKPGDRVVVDAMCGNKWDFDVSSVRSNPNPQFDSMLGERGDFRVIREAEALAVITEETAISQ